ncbi:hypothetical protein ACFE04_031417 [Oxalis oulophora]
MIAKEFMNMNALIIFCLVISLFVGQSAAKSRLTDPPPRDCYADCIKDCQSGTAKWLRWTCPVTCVGKCPMWGDPPLDIKTRVDEKCKLACVKSSCANISTPNNPAEDKVKQCAVDCSKKCS